MVREAFGFTRRDSAIVRGGNIMSPDIGLKSRGAMRREKARWDG
jgi:hypothetical protein